MIPKNFMKWFNSHFLDERDVIDVKHEYDRELTIDENKEIFKQKFSIHYCEDSKEIKAKVKIEKDKLNSEMFSQRKNYLEQRFGIELSFVR